MRPSDTQALRIAEQLLGRTPDHMEPFFPAVGGDDSHSFRVWHGDDAMLLKVKKHPGSPVGPDKGIFILTLALAALAILELVFVIGMIALG